MGEPSSRIAWLMVGALTVGFIALYVNIFAVPPVISSLVHDRKITHTEAGALMTVFTFVYGFGSVATGFLADRFGARLMMGSGLLLASAGALLFTLTDSYPLMVTTRAVIGWGAASMYAPGVRLGISWLSASRANVLMGVIGAAISIGVSIAYLITPAFSATYGWEGTLRTYAAVGFVVAVGVIVFCHEGNEVTGPRSFLPTAPVEDVSLLRNPTLLLASAGLFLTYFHMYGILTWIPPYLTEVLRFSSGEVGVASMMLAVVGVPGSLLVGWVADKTGRVVTVMVLGFALSATVVFLNWMVGFPFFDVAALCFVIAVGMSAGPILLFAVAAKVVPPQAVGRATGFATMIAYSGSFVSTYLGGFIITSTERYDLAFITYTAAVVVAAVVIGPLISRSLRCRAVLAAD